MGATTEDADSDDGIPGTGGGGEATLAPARGGGGGFGERAGRRGGLSGVRKLLAGPWEERRKG